MAIRDPTSAARWHGAGIRAAAGDLLACIGDYKAALPGEDSNGYVDPTPSEADRMLAAVDRALAGDLGPAAALLDRFDYDLLVFDDPESGGAHLMLRERRPLRRGWGLLLLNTTPAPAREAMVQVPHPIWDALSPELGLELYRRLGARHFMMAGAHRWANGRGSLVSDVARNPRSLFHRLHQQLAGPQTAVLQVHGFNHQSYPDYPDVVLSNGSPEPHAALRRLGDAIERRGERAGVFDGRSWAKLGATLNQQGRHTRAIGGRFYHLELRYRIRKDPLRRAALIEAIAEAVFGYTHVRGSVDSG